MDLLVTLCEIRFLIQVFFQGFFRTVKRPQKLNLELSFETHSSHQKIQCSKNEVVLVKFVTCEN